MNTSTRLVLSMLKNIQRGSLTVTLADGSQHFFGETNAEPRAKLAASMTLHDDAVFADTVRGGDIGFAECYIAGRVTTPHLPKLLTVLAMNRAAIDEALYGRWWGVILDKLLHLFRGNRKSQARKNIAAHYDLGNDF